MHDPTARNRLDEAASPYLQQHADNPVHWQPWDDAALDAATERDVPVFLSIGYSSCHWCHVMAEESFEDEAVARVLNEQYVPIKVDREERPDVDSVYQTVAQLASGQGGWPLSVWLTPDQRPFHVGTYFPREPRRGMPGFLDLLTRIATAWSQDRDGLLERADRLTRALTEEVESVPDRPASPDADLLVDAADAAVRSADREYGGFGPGQKFPQTTRVDLLFRAHDRTGKDLYRAVAAETLDALVEGGVRDHVGGGFHRYATDRQWTVPHFEKMLYDNAEIPRLLLAGYQVTGDDRYAAAARETFAFLDRELSHPDGGFYSTLDARSAGEEGRFYVWTPDQVAAAVDDPTNADLFCDRYGVTASGNFEDATVLTVSASVGDLADAYDHPEADVEARLADAREQVFAARAERERPARDEKVLAGWNGLAVSALAEAGIVLDPAYADRAAAALGFVRDAHWDADTSRLSRRFKDGDVAIPGYLEDYAFLARGALDCYQATGDVDHLAFAMDLARVIVEEFWDADAGTLYFTPKTGERLVARPQELRDQSTPSSAGVAAQVLVALSHFVPHDRFEAVATAIVETHASTVADVPDQYGALVVAADLLAAGHQELTIAAEYLPDPWRAHIAETYLPRRLLALRPPTDDGLRPWLAALGIDGAPPIWAGRERRDGRPTIYACRSFTCSPPQTDIDAALDWLAD